MHTDASKSHTASGLVVNGIEIARFNLYESLLRRDAQTFPRLISHISTTRISNLTANASTQRPHVTCGGHAYFAPS